MQCAGHPHPGTSWTTRNPLHSFFFFILKLGSCLNVLLSSRETKIHWHRVPQLYIKKRHIPVTQSLKKKKCKERPQKKKIHKSFGSTRGKNLQLEKAFVLILKHGITVISQLQCWIMDGCLLCIGVIKESTQVVCSKHGNRWTERWLNSSLYSFVDFQNAVLNQVISSKAKIVPGVYYVSSHYLLHEWMNEGGAKW